MTWIHTRPPRLEDLATQLQRAREQERAHLARELHDELGALLMAAKLDVACLKVNLGSAAPEIARRLVVSLENLARDFGLTSGIEIGIDLEAVSPMSTMCLTLGTV